MKIKKLLSVLTATALSLTMCLSTSILASARAVSTYDVTSYDELKNAIAIITNDADKMGTINITSDDISGTRVGIDGLNLTLNLKGHILNSALFLWPGSNVTINGDGGTIIGFKDSSDYSDMIPVTVNNSTLTATNTRFIGADGNATFPNGMYGIFSAGSIVKLDNCYVQSGNAVNTYARHAIVLEANCSLYLNNTTAVNGSRTENSYFVIYDADTSIVYDFNGTTIDKSEYEVYDTVTFGLGYLNIVNGNEIKDTDGNAKAQSPTKMTATIPEPTYTVTIPATVSFGKQKQALAKYKNSIKDGNNEDVVVEEKFEITAQNVDNLFVDETHEDTITVSVNYDGLMKNADSTATIPYAIKNVAAGTTTSIATFYNDVDVTEEHTNSVTLTASLNRTDLIADGTFTGTMTFTVGQTAKEAG